MLNFLGGTHACIGYRFSVVECVSSLLIAGGRAYSSLRQNESTSVRADQVIRIQHILDGRRFYYQATSVCCPSDVEE